jgi:hypothetical protein
MRWCVVVLAAIGCQPLADLTYEGEAMFTLEGTLSESNRPLQVDAKLALLWQDPLGAGGPGLHVTPIPFRIGSLGAFTASVPIRPEPAVRCRFDDGGPELAEAYFHMVTAVPLATSRADLGVDLHHVLIFAESDVTGGDAADYLGGPVSAGSHLRQFTVASTPGPAQRQLIERCVVATDDRAVCEVRRGYQLQPVDDGTPLTITLKVQ